jgi:hypothetical protein
MDETMRRRRKRQSDQYLDLDDDIVKDGELVRQSMLLADGGAFNLIDSHAARQRSPAPPPRFGRGYIFSDRGASNAAYYQARDAAQHLWRDAGRSPNRVGGGNIARAEAEDLPRGEPWPTQSGGVFPMWNNQVGAKCSCENGKPGTLQRAPDNSSVLYCRENAEDAASVYYRLRDEAPDEWKKYRAGPVHDCGCGGRAHDQQGTVGYVGPPPVQWPTGQRAGDPCTVNGSPGLLEARGNEFVCVPNRRDQAASNIAPSSAPVGSEWAQGGECSLGNGEIGRLVKQGDRLICKPCEIDMDSAQAKRDAAYWQSVRDAGNAWRNPW